MASFRAVLLTALTLIVFALHGRAEPQFVSALYDAVNEEMEYQGVIFRPVSVGTSKSHFPHKPGAEVPEEGAANLRPFSRAWWGALCVSLLCVASAALMSGLTLGLVSFDPFELHVVLNSTTSDCITPQEQTQLMADKRCAARVLPLVSRHHLLLVTLLLANTAANETLPIFLDKVVPSWVAIILSVTFVVIFGEVLPSAIFTGPRRLEIAARFSGVVWVLIGLLCPISWPISRVLDILMGYHRPRYSRHQLKAILRMHGPRGGGSGNVAPSAAAQQVAVATRRLACHQSRADWLSLGGLTHDELTIIDSVLESSNKTAVDVLIPLSDVFMLKQDSVLDIDTMADVMARGHSRVPVWADRLENIRGILLVKKLMVVGPENRRPVCQLPLRKPVCAHASMPILELLHALRKGRSHVAIISSHPREFERCLEAGSPIPEYVEVLGIVCLEDIFNHVIGEAFCDEPETSACQPGSRSPVTLRDAVSKVVDSWRHKRRNEPSSCAWQPISHAASYSAVPARDPDEAPLTPAELLV